MNMRPRISLPITKMERIFQSLSFVLFNRCDLYWVSLEQNSQYNTDSF